MRISEHRSLVTLFVRRNSLQCNDLTARKLMKLLGKDQGGIKDNLQLILGKKQDLSPRNRTEIQNRFNDVYAFFEELEFTAGKAC
ncbi:hypothetical protein Niako_1069 [Niastella koreensis GR20-10]|uniref:Uncharacterized protein n=2 Tax=Niastella koreensis TaxID=354356 RepID=G8THL9_NIAKG|nr:hypothetical protein Niako_1069 [Niastella koreensis GR20-10]